MINRKKLFIVVSLCVLIIATIVGFVFFSKKSPEDAQSRSKPFSVSGLDNPAYLFSPDKQSVIVDGIDYYLKADGIDTNNMTGVVREDSFTKKEVYGSTVITLLVDIADAKRTYKVSSSGSGSPDGDNSLYVLCPSQEELIYGSFNCKDDTNE